MPSEPAVSVIIPTRDRADVLRDCLEGIAAQSVSREAFEVIVVDNGSRDHTATVARNFSTAFELRVIEVTEPGLHAGRHAGAEAARSQVLLFADDDIVPLPSWIGSVATCFADGRVAMAGGNDLPRFESEPPEWLLEWWYEPVERGRALWYLSILDFGPGQFDIDPGYVWGCNFAVRREVLKECRGFHPDAMPADRLRWRGDGETHVSRHVRRHGLVARFDAGASVHHRVSAARMTPEYFAQRAFAQGISESYSDIRRFGAPRSRLFTLARHAATVPMAAARAVASHIGDEKGRELRQVKAAARAAYARGYRYHQREVQRDPDLLAWVLRADYLRGACKA